MKLPGSRKNKSSRIRGGGAAARAAQFALERGQPAPKVQATKAATKPKKEKRSTT